VPYAISPNINIINIIKTGMRVLFFRYEPTASCGTVAILNRSIIRNRNTSIANTYGRNAIINDTKNADPNETIATDTAISAGISDLEKNFDLDSTA
jgi:hypothetical protein